MKQIKLKSRLYLWIYHYVQAYDLFFVFMGILMLQWIACASLRQNCHKTVLPSTDAPCWVVENDHIFKCWWNFVVPMRSQTCYAFKQKSEKNNSRLWDRHISPPAFWSETFSVFQLTDAMWFVAKCVDVLGRLVASNGGRIYEHAIKQKHSRSNSFEIVSKMLLEQRKPG